MTKTLNSPPHYEDRHSNEIEEIQAFVKSNSIEPISSNQRADLSQPHSPSWLTTSSHFNQKSQTQTQFIKNAIINMMFILSWYLFATLISIYNKWMFSPEHYNFQYPLFVSSCHMLVQFILASLTLASFGSIRPTSRPTARDYGSKAVPCGIASGLDIGLSNTSLKTVTLSFYTMCKSSSLAFVLCFAFIFKLEKPTYKLTGIILLITSGVILMVSSETKFEFWGMIEVLSASCMGGLRWSLTQILLDKQSMGMNSPIATIFWLAPTMGITLALCSIIFEGWNQIISNDIFFGDLGKSLSTMGYILSAGGLAFLMTVSEYFLIQRTSVVTLSIAGVFKEVGTIFLSTVVFHDTMTPLNISGLAITIFGIMLYNILKYHEFTNVADSDRSNGPADIALETHTSIQKVNSQLHRREPRSLDPMNMRSSASSSTFLPVINKSQNYSMISTNEDSKPSSSTRPHTSSSSQSGSGSYDVVDKLTRSEIQHVIGNDDDEEDWERPFEGEEETGNGLYFVQNDNEQNFRS